ncbi:hypothetical protein GCM10028798_19670 [Humibacter antri]
MVLWLVVAFVKMFVLLAWFMIVILVALVWLITALVQACTRHRVSPFPARVNWTTNQLLRWMM